MNKIYLAFYKGCAQNRFKQLQDGIIRFLTKGQYSHCEIAIERLEQWGQYDYRPTYDCYTSSPRDGGVRCKQIDVGDSTKWDLILLDNVTEEQIKAYFHRTCGKAYDWWGAIGIVLGIKQKRSKYFCSEWCFNAIKNSDKGWRFSPNDLAIIFKK
ncbi:enoyl-CoA hydratase [Rodentibacter trehalosifermentans]|uniref:enoyl-CoA hydratase n=1 Tax=Rodentibacter trehalosifermentans TaxID=1908263 RepID=UPI0009874F71|nr:enoyl-CoA hydratase [Rodentibacter trehalosifermentans]OOF47613.1 enoyl-CoA hydratase [Rodentibacter trehalosifermentans]